MKVHTRTTSDICPPKSYTKTTEQQHTSPDNILQFEISAFSELIDHINAIGLPARSTKNIITNISDVAMKGDA